MKINGYWKREGQSIHKSISLGTRFYRFASFMAFLRQQRRLLNWSIGYADLVGWWWHLGAINLISIRRFSFFSLLSVHHVLGYELQRMWEYSESRPFPFWPLTKELMAQAVAAFSTGDLERPLSPWFFNFDQGVFEDGKVESGPRCVMAKFRLWTKQVVLTLWALVYTCIKVVPELFTSWKWAKRHRWYLLDVINLFKKFQWDVADGIKF